MIVTDKNVGDALAYLAIDPHPIALARKDLTDAENEKERIWAEVYAQQNGGSIPDREAACGCDPRVAHSRRVFAAAIGELERHKARVRAAEMLIEVWRSENANARAAEKVR